MRIAVVIPARDEEARISAAIRSAQEAGVEVIVVDGGSRDATAQRARACGARVLESAPGRARQLAAGAAAASDAEALVFLHADTTLPTGWSARLRFVELGVKLRLALAKLPYGDQALFVRTSVLRALGGVPQAPIMEDLDLVRGMRAHGALALLPEAVTTSARRYQARGVLRTMGRNWLALLAWSLGLDRARVAAWYRS